MLKHRYDSRHILTIFSKVWRQHQWVETVVRWQGAVVVDVKRLLSLYKSPSVKSIPPRLSWRWCVRRREGEGQWPWYVMKTDKNNSPNSQRGSRVEVPLVASSAAFRRQTAALSASYCSCSPLGGAILIKLVHLFHFTNNINKNSNILTSV